MAKSLLDLMPAKEREKALERYEKRSSRGRGMSKVSYELYITAEFGYYYGWGAIEAIRNNEITLPEVHALLEAARKVWYSKVIDQSHGNMVAGIASQSKEPGSSFNTNITSIKNKADIE